MAPEQAKGKAVDKRVDAWAFGCVLYECLTGQRAFRGESAAEVLARILETEPDWRRLPTTTPGKTTDMAEQLRRRIERECGSVHFTAGVELGRDDQTREAIQEWNP